MSEERNPVNWKEFAEGMEATANIGGVNDLAQRAEDPRPLSRGLAPQTLVGCSSAACVRFYPCHCTLAAVNHFAVVNDGDPPGEPAPIRNLPGYVFRAFVREVNRLKNKELAVLDAAVAGQTLAQRLADPSRQLEMKILVDECLAQFDFTERDMCWRRLEGFTWDEIGPVHGLSGHAAEVRFRNAVRAVKAKLARSRKPLPRTTQTAQNEQLMPGMEADDDKGKT